MIELHDSVVEVREESASIVLNFRPAYVHHWELGDDGWVGEGRSQGAELQIVGNADVIAPLGPVGISDGYLLLGGNRFDDMIPLDDRRERAHEDQG